MADIPLEFGIRSNPARFGHDGLTRLVNCYVENAGREGKSQTPVYAIEGLKSFSTLTNGGACRGMIVVGSDLYVASGRLVFKVDTSGTATEIGGIPSDGPVFFARNRASPNPEIAVVSEGNKYKIVSGTMSAINDPDLPTPNSVTFLDGYLVFGSNDGRFAWTGIDDIDDISALNFATAEQNPDNLVRAIAHNGQLFLFGAETVEVWVNTGATFPFERLSGVTIKRGALSAASIIEHDNSLIWVADDGTVRRLNGAVPIRISNHAVERSIRDEPNQSVIEAMNYTVSGHEFYVISGTTFSWAYDASTQLWHERNSKNSLNQDIGRWRGAFYAKFDGKHIVGDYTEGKLYELDHDTFDEAGNHLVMKMVSPHFHNYPNYLQMAALHVDLIPGVGLNSTDSHLSDPQLLVRTSYDGGNSWSNQRSLDIGQIGEHGKRIRANRFGQSREDGYVVELSMSAAVRRGFTGAVADIQVVK